MRYFVAKGETRTLDAAARSRQRGSSAPLAEGVTHYELSGPEDGPLVVFVPGLTIPLDFWDGAVGGLHALGCRTLTYSAFGRGYSDRVRIRYDRDLFAGQLHGLLAHVGAADVHLVASSMGALIALAYVRRPGTRVTSLSLSGPAGLATERNPASRLPDRGPIAPLVGRYLLRRSLLSHLAHNVQTPRDAERLRSIVLDGFQFEGSMYALLSTLMNVPLAAQDELFDARDRPLPPTLLLWGADDRVTPATEFDRAVSLLKPVESRLIADCGHMASFERPAEFVHLVGSFIVGQTQQSSAVNGRATP